MSEGISEERPSRSDVSGDAAFEWAGDATVAGVCATLVESVPSIRRALAERRAYVDHENPSGERVRAADQFADDLLEERLLAVDGVASYASEERADPVFDIGTDATDVVDATDVGARDGVDATDVGAGDGYHLAVDPLDGSSNLRSNSPMGTIVGVYDRALPAAGEHLVAATFVLYGPNTTMVVADGDRAAEYLVTDDGADLLTDELTVPDDPTVYAMGGRRPDWTDRVTAVTESFEADRLKLRYGGAFVADVMQVITHGGVFGYPELRDTPEGKLRYHFECAPTSMVVESAGGTATTGECDWRAVEPTELHERSPVYLGTESLVDEIEATFADW